MGHTLEPSTQGPNHPSNRILATYDDDLIMPVGIDPDSFFRPSFADSCLFPTVLLSISTEFKESMF
jgi:hypothetical protein